MGTFNANNNRMAAIVCASFGVIAMAAAAYAAPKASRQVFASTDRVPAATARVQEGHKPLDVRGQNRAWSKLVGGRGKKDIIDFVRARSDYKSEIERSGQ